MEAVEMLLRQRDEKTQQIAREIEMVEHELAKLTALELRNRGEQNDLHLVRTDSVDQTTSGSVLQLPRPPLMLATVPRPS